jgi:hypothetical protein
MYDKAARMTARATSAPQSSSEHPLSARLGGEPFPSELRVGSYLSAYKTFEPEDKSYL